MRKISYLFGSAAILFLAANTRASITGFGDFSGFSINQSDPYAAPSLTYGAIILTGSNPNAEYRSVFYDTKQPVSNFTATFTYQVQNGGAGYGGISFMLQDSPAGPDAAGGGMFSGSTGISPSVEITLEETRYVNGVVSDSGFYTNGATPTGSPSISPIDITSGDHLAVTIGYNGQKLTESITDLDNPNVSYSTFYRPSPDFESILGSDSAYVGFTASEYLAGATQTISNFSYVTIPEPASMSVLPILGSIGLMRRRG